MSIPILSMGTSRCWIDSRDPGINESADIEILNFWINTMSDDLFICTDATNPAQLMWKKITVTNPE